MVGYCFELLQLDRSVVMLEIIIGRFTGLSSELNCGSRMGGYKGWDTLHLIPARHDHLSNSILSVFIL